MWMITARMSEAEGRRYIRHSVQVNGEWKQGVGRVYGEGRIEGVALGCCLYFESAAGYAAYVAQGLEVSEIIQARAPALFALWRDPCRAPTCRVSSATQLSAGRSRQSLISTGKVMGFGVLAGWHRRFHSQPADAT